MYKNIYEKMNVAYLQAKKAADEGEVPVGCAVFYGEELISASHNTSERTGDPTDHAEMKAIKEAIRIAGRKKIRECELFVTLEPCPMCAGGIIHAGIKSVYFASYDNDFGACDGFTNLFTHPHAKGISVYGGIMEEKCNRLLKDFFAELRRNDEH